MRRFRGQSPRNLDRRRLVGASAADSVTLHAARIRGALQQTVLARDRADAAERPVAGHLDVVAALAQIGDDLFAEARLELDLTRLAVARVERAREVVRVEARRVDRLLQIQAAVDMPEEEVERPLVLLVAAGRAEREVWVAAAECKRRRERRARALAGLERVRQPLLEPEHLRARAQREAELRHDRRAPEPAAGRRRRHEVAPPVDDVDVARVSGARRLADSGCGRTGDGRGQPRALTTGPQLGGRRVADARASLVRVRAAQQEVEWYVGEVGIS